MGLPQKPTLIYGEILRVADDYRSLDDVLQFANITRPGVRLKEIEALLAHRLKALSCFPCVTFNEEFAQQRDVSSSLPQRRHLNRKHVEPVKQMAPEHARAYGSLHRAHR